MTREQMMLLRSLRLRIDVLEAKVAELEKKKARTNGTKRQSNKRTTES